MWSLTLQRERRTTGPENFPSLAERDFFNTICQKPTSLRFKRAVSVLLIDMSTATPKMHCKPPWPNSEIRASLRGILHIGTAKSVSGGYDHEIVIRLRRALSYRYPVNRIAEQPERYGNVTNRNGLRHPASQHHGRSAEASGKAATAGGNATRVRSGGTPSGPDIAIHSNGDWDAVGCAGSCHGEACPARERGQQLQRWLRNKLQTRQGPLGWMQRIGGLLLSFLSNVYRHTHPQELRGLRGNQNVPGLGPTTSLVVLHRPADWGEISGHRS